MNRSLSSVLIVVGSLIVAFFITWLYLRSKSDSRPIKAPFDHAFVKAAHQTGKPFLLVRFTSPEQLHIKRKADAKFTLGAWLDVRLGGENQLIVSPQEILPSGPQKGKPIEIASAAECKSAGLHELSDFADLLRERPAILNLISRRPGLSNKILEIWAPGRLLSIETVAIQSESDGTLKELRDAQPRGFYGSSQATLIQMEILSNLSLEGLMELKADLLVSSTEELSASEGARGGNLIPRVREATLLEAHRRGLKRYAGPARNKVSAEHLLKLGYDGVLIETPETLDLLAE